MNRLVLAASAAIALAGHAPSAHAFCGFYVAGGNQQMFNDATQVVLMRKGTRTVLAMQNNYKGPPDAFAMVIPVPTVLHEKDVKTLNADVFKHVEQMGAPRLVEYWEQDPCQMDNFEADDKVALAGAPMAVAKEEKKADSLGVKIEAKFVVGEYQIVILSAKDSTGLDTWLRQEKYNIPAGAEPLLRPYVESGMKFFVAKVDPKKVKFVDGRAALSPLRFHYDSDHFELPIRLGLANSQGTQDLIVNIFAPNQRYEVANYPNVTIPTNIDVKDSVKDKFGAFYTALFDRTIEKHPGAVVTEYAWAATTCDPCPGPTLDPSELAILGADVLDPKQSKEDIYSISSEFVLTRLHARYGKDIKDDLVFKTAEPIVGGREFVVDAQTGKLEEGARKDSINNFQGRYAIRHKWTGQINCPSPRRNVWGGPPGDPYGYNPPQPALGLAFAPRGQVQLQQVVKRDLPEIGVKMIASPDDPPAAGAKAPREPVEPVKQPGYAITKPASGCGCRTNDPSGAGAVLAALGLATLVSRRRRS